jgi:hypothetical protein
MTAYGDIVEAQKQRELSAVGQNAKAREEIERKYAKKQQQIAIMQAIINGALGVTKAFAQSGIFGYITGALIALATFAEIQVIRAQKFAKGGKVRPGHELPGAPAGGDNTLALVKPGEVILNERQQLYAGGADFFKSIGVPGFQTGGVVGEPAPATTSLEGGSLVRQLAAAMNTMRVVLNVNELNDAQDELNVINKTSGL